MSESDNPTPAATAAAQDTPPKTLVPIRLLDSRSGSRLPGVMVHFKPDVAVTKKAASVAAAASRRAADHAVELTKEGADDEELAKAHEAATAAAEQSERAIAEHGVVAGRDSILARTDDAGDVSDVSLEHGPWAVSLLSPQHRPEIHQLKVPADVAELDGKKIYRLAHLTEDIDQKLGWWVLGSLCAALMMLIVVYVAAHRKYPEDPSLGVALFDLSANTKVALNPPSASSEESFQQAVASMQQGIEHTEAREGLIGKLADVGSRVAELEKLLLPATEEADKDADANNVVDAYLQLVSARAARDKESKAMADEGKTGGASEDPSESVENGLALSQEGEQLAAVSDAAEVANAAESPAESATAAVVEAEKTLMKASDAAVAKLAEIDVLAAAIRETEQRDGVATGKLLLWRTGPKWFLEILFWALGGILVRLIFNVGDYVRWHRFYRSGLALHIKLLCISPILTLVYVLLISLVKIDTTAAVIDLSDPHILAGISFLLAATPWKTWERLLGLANQVRGGGQDKVAG